jgi:paraquat-inducible protein B
MAKPVNSALIGAFVLGSVILAVVAVLIFGSGKFLSRKAKIIMFFDNSVKGLNVGAPVVFSGVRIGSVTDIQLLMDPSKVSFTVPVIAEILPEKVTMVGADHRPVDRYFKVLVAKGLRAQLQVQSFVTGQLMVGLDFVPDKPARFMRGGAGKYAEIPTVPSSFQELSRTLGDLPIQELVTKLTSAVDGLNKMLNSPVVTASLNSVDLTLRETVKTLKTVNRHLEPMISSLSDTTDNIRSATGSIDRALQGERGLPAQLERTFASARSAIGQAEKTLAALEGSSSETSALSGDLAGTLEELRKSARSVRFLSDYLQQHPESLITGKKEP